MRAAVTVIIAYIMGWLPGSVLAGVVTVCIILKYMLILKLQTNIICIGDKSINDYSYLSLSRIFYVMKLNKRIGFYSDIFLECHSDDNPVNLVKMLVSCMLAESLNLNHNTRWQQTSPNSNLSLRIIIKVGHTVNS